MARMSDLESVFCRTAPWRRFARRHVLPRVLSDDPIGPDVLEIGCGSGAMAAAVLTSRPEVSTLVATDVDPAMVHLASRTLTPHGDRARAQQVDASTLPFADATFDTAASWLMLHHTIAWEAVLAETFRVIRPGGRLVGYDLPDSTRTRFIHAVTRSTVRMIPADDLARELHRIGFSVVEVEPLGLLGAYRFAAVR
ncbi:MAG: class I SAM-dependent methyltransferase [Actinomycetales bacterium]|nr:MAG: class I SAM-dependent methyltransferase [Actinomycetales bacterium]